MKRFVATAAVVLAAAWFTPAAIADSDYAALDPGGPASLSEKVPVQFVFVAIEPGEAPQATFANELPKEYKPVIRSRLWYGVTELLGIDYTFDYKVVYTDAAFEDKFFAALAKLAEPADRTLFQNEYNAQRKNVLDVGQNHFIDAPTVEKWLIDNAPRGVDTRRNTVFFIDWYGRSDFKFHVYTKFGEPDPDTGYDFGVKRESRKIVAWGGTTPDDEETGLGGRAGERRVWFYDLSAGPEAWGGSYNVDDHDIDGDGRADYRLPVSWEYTAGGFRSAGALAGDLGKVARYGAINLLFTPSPLYPPYITPDRQPASINLDSTTFEGWPGVDGSERFQTPSLLVDEISEVHRVPYTYDEADEPLSGRAERCYLGLVRGYKCYPAHANYHYFANLFLFAAKNLPLWQDGEGGEYETALHNYVSKEPAPFLGYADDNWLDGTQSGTFNFVNPAVSDFYGLTTTQIHEYGHHFGMSHPHDGYDYETGVDYGPTGRYFFAWLADEVNSMMSYIDLNWDYSQFDRDNANRFQAAAYVINANEIAADILGSPDAEAASDDLRRADDEIGKAEAAMAAHDYVGAFDHAKAGYEYVRAGAAKAGVEVAASANGWSVLPPVKELNGAGKRAYSYKDPIGAGTQRSKP